MVLLPAQGMDVPAIAKAAFTSEDRVRDVIRNFSNVEIAYTPASASWLNPYRGAVHRA